MPEQNKVWVLRKYGQFNPGVTGNLLIGVAAMLGRVIWSWTVITTALWPIGVLGAHRSTLGLHPTILLSFFMIGTAATAMVAWKLTSKAAWIASTVNRLGVLIFVVNVAFVLTTGDDAPVWPTHYLGIFAVPLARRCWVRRSSAREQRPLLLHCSSWQTSSFCRSPTCRIVASCSRFRSVSHGWLSV